MNILLHICCAPCSLYTVDKLRQDGHKIEGFFYNPNIYPLSEYKFRRQAVVEMANRLNINITFNDDVWQLSRAACLNLTPAVAKQQRCANCWRMRLSEAVNAARQGYFDAFTTTLLISPYQDHEAIRNIASRLGQESAIDFYYDDFRAGFRQSQQMARGGCYYRQKYCGCEYSIEEKQRVILREPRSGDRRI